MTSEPKAGQKQDLPIMGFRDAAAFAVWLDTNQASSKGLWLKLAKRGNRTSGLTHAQQAALRALGAVGAEHDRHQA